jgi:hypothetical protein
MPTAQGRNNVSRRSPKRHNLEPADPCPHVPADARATAGHGAKAQAVRERAILTLLTERTIGKAASKCGVNERTLRRWLSEDEGFRRDYAAARQATFEAGISRVHALTARAIDTLEALLGTKAPPSVRLGAARTVMELGVHLHDAETIMKKLEDVEAFQQEQASRKA